MSGMSGESSRSSRSCIGGTSSDSSRGEAQQAADRLNAGMEGGDCEGNFLVAGSYGGDWGQGTVVV